MDYRVVIVCEENENEWEKEEENEGEKEEEREDESEWWDVVHDKHEFIV